MREIKSKILLHKKATFHAKGFAACKIEFFNEGPSPISIAPHGESSVSINPNGSVSFGDIVEWGIILQSFDIKGGDVKIVLTKIC